MSTHSPTTLSRKFIDTNRSLIVAPAGFGKTQTILTVASLVSSKILVLTHTNAGVTAIKQRLKRESIDNCWVETIAGYVQKYVHAYTSADSILDQSNDNEYYPYIYERFKLLLDRGHIQRTLGTTYGHVVVDEYQDCDLGQHVLILGMSSIVPVHILGDEMQGIFFFGSVKRLDWGRVEQDFVCVGELETPHRWRVGGGNSVLGDQINEIRNRLENSESIDLQKYSAIELVSYGGQTQDFCKSLHRFLDVESNLLIIDPRSESRGMRLEVIKRTGRRGIYMLEAINGKDFYNMARTIDEIMERKVEVYPQFRDLVMSLLSLSEMRQHLPQGKPKTRTNDEAFKAILADIQLLNGDPTPDLLKKILLSIKALKPVRVYSQDQYQSLIRALDIASTKGITITKAMEEVRNQVRLSGRILRGHAIGTTLLTKGLEVDTVIIRDAEKFHDPKNFYVAISRATKRLIVFSGQSVFSPYSD